MCAGLGDPSARVQLAAAGMLAQALTAAGGVGDRTRTSLQVPPQETV
jgi:hypothetical protein